MNDRRLLTALATAVLLPLAAAVMAQVSQQDPEWRPRIWVGGGGIGRFTREPPKWAKLENFDGSFNFCRAYFTADRFEQGGSGWNTDFPGADNNFSVRLGELTSVHIKLDKTGQPTLISACDGADAVVHLAGANEVAARHDPEAAVADTVRITQRVASAAIAAGVS